MRHVRQEFGFVATRSLELHRLLAQHGLGRKEAFPLQFERARALLKLIVDLAKLLLLRGQLLALRSNSSRSSSIREREFGGVDRLAHAR